MKESEKPQPTEPVDIVDGIPDRAARRPLWKYIFIAIVFLAWVAILVYLLVGGR